jgi:hypothetical protein
MSSRRKNKAKPAADNLIERIRKAARGLYYQSETDAEIFPFRSKKAETISKEILLMQIGKENNSAVQERNFEDFFSRLTKIEDWFGDEEKQTAQKFSELQKLLQTELKDLKVFKVGEIEKDVYVVGLDAQGVLSGIKTRAVET